ncbi:MAG: hypothetical protein WC578_05305 [Candidatus Omnitrophota bacterium]|jgi:glucan phosphoethanolaminetransferase (alkaline phosphatase superfamily)
MREHLAFLKTSSLVVKIAAWIFLLLGVVGGLSLVFGAVPGNSRWMGVVVLVVYTFFFFFLFLIAKIADLLIRIINEIKKE